MYKMFYIRKQKTSHHKPILAGDKKVQETFLENFVYTNKNSWNGTINKTLLKQSQKMVSNRASRFPNISLL